MSTQSEDYRILISDKLSPKGVEWLESQDGIAVDYKPGLTPEELAEVIGDYDALVIRSATKVTSDILEKGERLSVVGRAGIGVDNVDVEEATRRGVLVMNEPSGNNITTAEHAVSLMLSLARNIPQAAASMNAGRWEKSRFTGIEITGRTLGLIGLGNIGKLVAERATGLKLEVIAHDPYVTADAAAKVGAKTVDLEELLERADIISIHTPLLPQTRGLIDADAFSRMKDGVMLINAARGGIVDEQALLDAIESGKVARAAIDVFETEPPAADHPLLGHDRVVCTPHLGASTVEAQDRVAVELCRQIVALLRDGSITNAVNLPRVHASAQGKLQGYTVLGERLGRLAGALASSIQSVEVTTSGRVFDKGQGFVTHAVLKGLLANVVERPINLVNSTVLAGEMGWTHKSSHAPAKGPFTNVVRVAIETPDGTREVAGTLFGDEPRVVSIDDVTLEARLEGVLFVMRNDDQPGVIGGVGTRLGENQINIARCQVALPDGDGAALSVWNVGEPVSDEILESVRSVPHVQTVIQVQVS